MSVGTIHKKDDLFMTVYVGEATAKDGTKYEMTVGASNMSPMVQNMTTGKRFSLSWTDIINLAIEAGIDKE